jgi:hypothetical protein
MLSHPGHPQGDQGLQPQTGDNPRPVKWASAPTLTPGQRSAVGPNGPGGAALDPVVAHSTGAKHACGDSACSHKTRPTSSASSAGNGRKRPGGIPICFAVPS